MTIPVNALPVPSWQLAKLAQMWLPKQRWFAGGRKPPVDVTVMGEAVLRAGDAPLLALLVESVGERYQLLIGVAPPGGGVPAGVTPVTILGAVPGASGAAMAYDALADPAACHALIDLLLQGEEIQLAPAGTPGGATAGEAGQPEVVPPDGLRAVLGPSGALALGAVRGTDVRPLGVEQSNSSIVFGEQVILKVFRRPVPGANPEVEITAALERVGFTACAQPLGWLEGFGAVLALAQPYFADAVEGWKLAVGSVEERLAEGDRKGGFGSFAGTLGEMTARLHAALKEAFGATAIDADGLAVQQARRLADLDAAVTLVPALAALAPRIATTYRDAAEAGGFGVQRIHGDYHLGQVLHVPTGWIALDFEGEPAREASQRMLPDSPLRDVAGMLRSLDYAGHHPLVEREDAEASRMAVGWVKEAREALLAAYRIHTGLLDDDEAKARLLAYELEKAVYEVAYEGRYRPAWLPLPLGGIARLLAG